MTSDSEQIRAEEIIPQKWEKCTANLLVNSGFGLATGIVASVVLFRRRFWPIPLSVGFAAGSSYQECKQSFAPDAIPLPGVWKKLTTPQETSAVVLAKKEPKH